MFWDIFKQYSDIEINIFQIIMRIINWIDIYFLTSLEIISDIANKKNKEDKSIFLTLSSLMQIH